MLAAKFLRTKSVIAEMLLEMLVPGIHMLTHLIFIYFIHFISSFYINLLYTIHTFLKVVFLVQKKLRQ